MVSAIAEEFEVEPPQLDIPFAGRSDRSIVADVFEAAGVPFDETNRSRFTTRYLDHLDHELANCDGRVFEGVVESLKVVGDKTDVGVGLLTGNLEAAAWKKVRRFGLESHFSFGGFGDSQPNRDDIAREASDAATQKFAREFDQLVVIGDTPADVQCGRAIGAITVAVATGSFPLDELSATKPDLAVATLHDAMKFFESL